MRQGARELSRQRRKTQTWYSEEGEAAVIETSLQKAAFQKRSRKKSGFSKKPDF